MRTPLTTPIRPLESFLEKSAASPIGNVPDDVEKWPAHVLSELQRVFPFLGKYDVAVNIDKVDAEVGYGAGYAMIRNFSARNLPQADVVALRNYVRIPIIIQERKLLRPKSFELGGEFYALNKQRIGQAMSTTQIFDGAENPTKLNTSLFDEMFPAYHRRNGTGRIYDGKIASAQDMLDKAAEGREKIAAFLSSHIGGPWFGDKEWLEQFYSTPFFEEAQQLLVKDAQNDVEAAKRRAAMAEEGIARARLDVEGAELSAKLASYMHSAKGVPENETLAKLSSACGKAGAWAGEFANSPFYEDALAYRAKTAQMALRDTIRDLQDPDSERYRMRSLGVKELEAKLAAWKYEQATGREFPAEKTASSLLEHAAYAAPSALLGAAFVPSGRLRGALYGAAGNIAGGAVGGALGGPSARLLGSAAGTAVGIGAAQPAAPRPDASLATAHGGELPHEHAARLVVLHALRSGEPIAGLPSEEDRRREYLALGGEPSRWAEKGAELPPALVRAGIGAGIGAVGGGVLAGKGERKKGALRGAMLGAGAGAATTLIPASVTQAASAAAAPHLQAARTAVEPLRAAVVPHVQRAQATVAPLADRARGAVVELGAQVAAAKAPRPSAQVSSPSMAATAAPATIPLAGATPAPRPAFTQPLPTVTAQPPGHAVPTVEMAGRTVRPAPPSLVMPEPSARRHLAEAPTVKAGDYAPSDALRAALRQSLDESSDTGLRRMLGGAAVGGAAGALGGAAIGLRRPSDVLVNGGVGAMLGAGAGAAVSPRPHRILQRKYNAYIDEINAQENVDRVNSLMESHIKSTHPHLEQHEAPLAQIGPAAWEDAYRRAHNDPQLRSIYERHFGQGSPYVGTVKGAEYRSEHIRKDVHALGGPTGTVTSEQLGRHWAQRQLAAPAPDDLGSSMGRVIGHGLLGGSIGALAGGSIGALASGRPGVLAAGAALGGLAGAGGLAALGESSHARNHAARVEEHSALTNIAQAAVADPAVARNIGRKAIATMHSGGLSGGDLYAAQHGGEVGGKDTTNAAAVRVAGASRGWKNNLSMHRLAEENPELAHSILDRAKHLESAVSSLHEDARHPLHGILSLASSADYSKDPDSVLNRHTDMLNSKFEEARRASDMYHVRDHAVRAVTQMRERFEEERRRAREDEARERRRAGGGF